jgi:hypothetical protein
MKRTNVLVIVLLAGIARDVRNYAEHKLRQRSVHRRAQPTGERSDSGSEDAGASAESGSGRSGPIHAEFNRAFVLMQYFGYLRRNPDDLPDTDYSGFNVWLNQLNVAKGNYIKAEMVRSFLVSSEYRRRFGTQ